jgi:hypothetical protein
MAEKLTPQISDEEIERRIADKGRCYTIDEVIAHLGSL